MDLDELKEKLKTLEKHTYDPRAKYQVAVHLLLSYIGDSDIMDIIDNIDFKTKEYKEN